MIRCTAMRWPRYVFSVWLIASTPRFNKKSVRRLLSWSKAGSFQSCLPGRRAQLDDVSGRIGDKNVNVAVGPQIRPRDQRNRCCLKHRNRGGGVLDFKGEMLQSAMPGQLLPGMARRLRTGELQDQMDLRPSCLKP